ncbi:MAG: MgtC/SapB family protein [Alphaproteobacteria bacterium]|nr:MgtC/SapB family protein [Alphaproteobacteria bacterium]
MLGFLRVDLLGELVLASILGGLVGLEREAKGKPAGLRTNLLICVGAALLTDLSAHFDRSGIGFDPTRIAAQIVSGIGFLGAGTILQHRGAVSGLTTAATLWVVAAIGMACGSGHVVEAVGTTALVLVALLPLGAVERWLAMGRHSRRFTFDVRRSAVGVDAMVAYLQTHGLRVRLDAVELDGEIVRGVVEVRGRSAAIDTARNALIAHPEVVRLVAD